MTAAEIQAAVAALRVHDYGEEGEDSLFATTNSRVCGVCTVNFARYKCPRCSAAYCSLPCYKRHGERCTEGFYKEQAKEQLQSNVSSEDDKLKMMKTLQRMQQLDDAAGGEGFDRPEDYEEGGEKKEGGEGEDPNKHNPFRIRMPEEEDEDDQEEDSPELRERLNNTQRLAKLLEDAGEDGTIDESNLSPAERAEFKRLLADGSLGAQLQAGTSVWWRAEVFAGGAGGAVGAAVGAITIVEGEGGGGWWRYNTEEAMKMASSAGAPDLPKALPPLTALTSKAPPSTLLNNLLEVICSYVYVVRLFCAAEGDDPVEAAAALLTLSAVLRNEMKGAHVSAEAALLAFASSCEESKGYVATSQSFGAACIEDTIRLAQHAGMTALALAGITAVLEKAAKLRGKPKKKLAASSKAKAAEKEAEEEEPRVALLRAKKKAHFLEVWWASMGHAERQTALGTLQFALKRELERREVVRLSGANKEQGAPKTAKVEEVS